MWGVVQQEGINLQQKEFKVCLLLQDKPESFEMLYRGSPSEALQRASEVLSVYWELVTTSDAPVDWSCQNEYTESFSSTTELSTESPTEYFTGGNLSLLERFCDELCRCLEPLRSQIMCPFLQTVMIGTQRRRLKQDQLETCTSSGSSLHPSAEDCCSYWLSTVSSHTRYQGFYFVNSKITCALIKFAMHSSHIAIK